jgi:hypothetical protein
MLAGFRPAEGSIFDKEVQVSGHVMGVAAGRGQCSCTCTEHVE